VRAPIASGTLDDNRIEVLVRASELTVLDPNQSAGTRAEIQRRMLGPEVLDSARFPEIAFRSTTVEPGGTGHWRVTGDLRLHGRVRSVTAAVVERDGHYLGSLALKQRDFGIEPISIAVGTVKVKDALKLEFDIVLAP
jgi:polyisoprenoid-binding protein YceI